ncbi:MAG: NAD(P)/FAD-dependent oxidoreductase [Bacillota bacterium]
MAGLCEMDAQVIIAGAGPAGAWLAYQLAREDISTLLLEKDRVPRYKSCGGALSRKTCAILTSEFDPGDIPTEVAIDRLTFCCPGQPDVNYHSPGNAITMVMRDRLDAFLARQAHSAGATLVEGETVREVQVCDDGVTVHTGRRRYRGELLAGADGAGSAVARRLGIEPAESGAAVQGEVRGRIPEDLWGRITLDYGSVRNGYSWVFPKRDHVSIGTGCMRGRGYGLRARFFSYLNRLGIDPDSCRIFLRGHPIPWGMRGTMAGERFLLVGDAAHLADPLTGEGIYSALRSAQLAAAEIISALKRGRFDLRRYAEAVREQMGPEIRAAALLGRLVFRWPGAVHRLLRTSPAMMNTVMSMVQGETSCLQAHATLIEALMMRAPTEHS